MHKRTPLLMVLTLGVLAACARSTILGTLPNAPAAQTAKPQITRLIIDYTPAATKQTADDERFDGQAFNKAIGRGLTAGGLADLANAAVIGVAAIEVDEFDVRATSNVILMGRVASAGVLGATVRIRDGSGTELRKFHVRADMRLNLVRNGSDPDTLGKLYQGFTSLVADELTATPGQPAQGR
jgi:hypothetical protein